MFFKPDLCTVVLIYLEIIIRDCFDQDHLFRSFVFVTHLHWHCWPFTLFLTGRGGGHYVPGPPQKKPPGGMPQDSNNYPGVSFAIFVRFTCELRCCNSYSCVERSYTKSDLVRSTPNVFGFKLFFSQPCNAPLKTNLLCPQLHRHPV